MGGIIQELRGLAGLRSHLGLGIGSSGVEDGLWTDSRLTDGDGLASWLHRAYGDGWMA